MEKTARVQQQSRVLDAKSSGGIMDSHHQNGGSASTSANSSSTLASNLPVASVEAIKIMAESIGISNLNEEGAKEIVNDLSFTLKFIILVREN